MVSYQIRDSVFTDIRALCGSLRFDDWAEITCFGIRPFVAIRRCYRESHIRRTAVVNGHVAAMWGVAGSLFGTGEPWLLTGAEIERVPVSFIREGRAELSDMLSHCARLEGFVVERYKRAHRLLEVLGFELSEPFLMKNVLVRRYTKDA